MEIQPTRVANSKYSQIANCCLAACYIIMILMINTVYSIAEIADIDLRGKT